MSMAHSGISRNPNKQRQKGNRQENRHNDKATVAGRVIIRYGLCAGKSKMRGERCWRTGKNSFGFAFAKLQDACECKQSGWRKPVRHPNILKMRQK